jgi:hypothetical protein
MPSITPVQAQDIVAAHPDAAEIQKKKTDEPLKYAFRYKLLNPNGRHISIACTDTRNDDSKAPAAGVTVYIAGTNRRLEEFPHATAAARLPGVTVSERYPKGSRGHTGDKGLSSAAASCETLDPMNNEVLRLSVADQQAMKRLLAWYAADAV